MSENSIFNEEQEDEFNFVSFLLRYLRNWYWFVLTLSLGYAGAYIYLKQYTPIYRVNATLLIKDERFKSNGGGLVEELAAVGSKQIENEIEIFKSRLLIGRVIDALDLSVSYWQEKKFRDIELYRDCPISIKVKDLNYSAYTNPFYIKYLSETQYTLLDTEQNTMGTFGFSQLINSPYGKFRVFRNKEIKLFNIPIKIVFYPREELISGLLNDIQVVTLNNKASFISLSIDIASRDKGKAILSKVLDEYEFTSLEDKNRESANTLRFIEERLKLVTNELGDVEHDVEQYQRSQGVSDLSTEASLFLSKVGENDAKMNELDIQTKILVGVDNYLNNSDANNLVPATLMLNDQVLSGYIAQYAQLESERIKLVHSVQPENPILITLNNQMRNVRQAIRENLNNQKRNISLNRINLLNLNNRLEGSISAIPRKEREFIGIKRQAGIKENLYLLLLQKREETALSYASTVTDSRVIDMPYSTGGPIKPIKKNIYQIAFLIGLIIPITLIILKELLINTIQSKREVERKTGLKVFGEISFSKSDSNHGIIDVNSRSFIGEQIRMIRSNLPHLVSVLEGGDASTFLFTSFSSGEGKSFVTINIALSLALLNKKVVIIQLDLRKPKDINYLLCDSDYNETKGISTFLIGKASTEEIIRETKFENLYIIPSGPIPPNPSELISNGRIKELFQVLKSSFDYILIDTAPLGLVTDATLLAAVTDVCFFVVRHESTYKSVMPFIKDLNKKKTYKSFNLIFNAVNYKNMTSYGYGYGYGYGYYGKEEDKYTWINSFFSKNLKSNSKYV